MRSQGSNSTSLPTLPHLAELSSLPSFFWAQVRFLIGVAVPSQPAGCFFLMTSHCLFLYPCSCPSSLQSRSISPSWIADCSPLPGTPHLSHLLSRTVRQAEWDGEFSFKTPLLSTVGRPTMSTASSCCSQELFLRSQDKLPNPALGAEIRFPGCWGLVLKTSS